MDLVSAVSIQANSKVRESSFELIRLLAQWMIVVYHIYSVHIYALNNVPFNKAIWLPLHIGVPLFILIGGYWGIRVSGKLLRQLIEQMPYVDLVLGSCFAEMGTNVTDVDIDVNKINKLNQGEMSIYEPELKSCEAERDGI